MPEKFIPEHIDPFRFAEQGLRLEGLVKIAEMQRLSSILGSLHEGMVTVDLAFGVDEQGLTFLKGSLKTEVKLLCQRCMELFSHDITAQFKLGIVNTLEEANSLPEHYEPALTQNKNLALRELIEDEIILNLPIIPRHAPELCKISLPVAQESTEHAEKKQNPFKVLESLKHKEK